MSTCNRLYLETHPKLHSIKPPYCSQSLISQNPREHMFLVQISLLIVTFLPLTSRALPLMQTTKEVDSHPHIVPYVNMWSVFFYVCRSFNSRCMDPPQYSWTRKHYPTVPHSTYPVGPGWWKRKRGPPSWSPVPSPYPHFALSKISPIIRGSPCASNPHSTRWFPHDSGGDNVHLAEGYWLFWGPLPGLDRHGGCGPL